MLRLVRLENKHCKDLFEKNTREKQTIMRKL